MSSPFFSKIIYSSQPLISTIQLFLSSTMPIWILVNIKWSLVDNASSPVLYFILRSKVDMNKNQTLSNPRVGKIEELMKGYCKLYHQKLFTSYHERSRFQQLWRPLQSLCRKLLLPLIAPPLKHHVLEPVVHFEITIHESWIREYVIRYYI